MSEIWRPSPARVADANLTRFIESVSARKGLKLRNYDDLYAWSISRPTDFWEELARFADVRADWGTGPALEQPDQMPGARFFPNARLNFAENLLRFRDEQPALIFRNERATRREISYRQLHDEVARIADGLKAAGVAAGDRVAGFLPNIPEAAIAMLATTSLGAVWSSCSPDFGVHGVLDRFGQIAPKVLFAADGYFYAGKSIDSLTPIAEVLAKIPSIKRVVVIPYVSAEPELRRLGGASSKAVRFGEFGTRGGGLGAGSGGLGTPGGEHSAPSSKSGTFDGGPGAARDPPGTSGGPGDAGNALVTSGDGLGASGPTLQFAQMPFNHPLYILYSSGTTGVPKCIVHGAGGTLLQHQKEHLLHTDVKRTDRLFYFTTCGWMMWNWLVSGLATGATLVLYDGSPFHPDAGVLWRLAQEERVTIFGTSAKYISALEKSSFVPAKEVDLSALRTILSTGSPLLPDGFDYVYQSIKADVLLASISGGTDIVSCFALGCPTRPVHRGEIQSRGLGMSVDIFDDSGKPVRGDRGELVCSAPFPSMPVGFWNDPDGVKYRAAYFERFPGVWHHGDYAALTEHDGIVIYGRSDAVLNPGGVRIGTAEIYAAVESLDEIIEGLAIGQDWQGDVRVVLFVRLKPAIVLAEPLKKKIRDTIRAHTTPRHVPAKIIAVPDIPRTLSGKLTELAVRNVVHGLPVKNIDALANPNALEHFRNLDELAS